MTRPRISGIYHMANAPAPTGAEAKARNREAYARAWHQFGLVVIDLADVLDDWTRQAIENEAVKQYGKRAEK